MKKPAVCILLFLASAALLGVLYYLVAVTPDKLDTGSYGIHHFTGLLGYIPDLLVSVRISSAHGEAE